MLKDTAMKKIAVIGIPGKWSSERLADTLQHKTGFRMLISIDEITFDLQKKAAFCRGQNLSEFDALVIKKVGQAYSHHMLDRLELLNFINCNGVRIFSDPASILKAVDRLTCTLVMRQNDIPMPDTVITENVEKALQAIRKFGKAVFKPLFTSKARGMKIVSDGPTALAEIESFRAENNPVMYIQRMIEIPGKDLGLVFLGGHYIATYARVRRAGCWNTTTHSGGQYAPYEPSQEIISLGCRAQELFNLDFTCVDIAETSDGPTVFEVSAFGGFRGLLEACNIDAAELFAQYILDSINNGTTDD
jgi:ribosomal protein S6--L-glutamate ligase